MAVFLEVGVPVGPIITVLIYWNLLKHGDSGDWDDDSSCGSGF